MDTKAIRQQLNQLRNMRAAMKFMGSYNGQLDEQIKSLNAMLRNMTVMKVVGKFMKG